MRHNKLNKHQEALEIVKRILSLGKITKVNNMICLLYSIDFDREEWEFEFSNN